MTEYGRGPGSEPWHPEDPLYGDGGWEGQHAHPGQQPAYGGQQHQHPYPQGQQQPPQQQGYGDWGQAQAQQYDPQYQGYDQQQYPGQEQQQYAQQNQQPYHEGYQEGGWDGSGTHAQVPYAADPGDPYGQQAAAYGAQQPDFYGTPDAYPPPEPPGRRQAAPGPDPEAATTPEPAPEPGQENDRDPGPDQGEHAFFAGGAGPDDGDDGPDGDEPEGRGERRGRGGKDTKGGKGAAKGAKGKKSRNGVACLVVALVFTGGLAGVSYLGYHFYQNRYSAAPDFAGAGTGQSVSIEVPKGSGGAAIGRLLKDAGVVKSVDAFVSAVTNNPDGAKIQAGVYILKKEMSAKNAVAMMLDGDSQANVLVKPGQRNVEVYKVIDRKLGLSDGSTRKIAEKEYKTLGLPAWANSDSDIKDPLEGFLLPGTYPAAEGMKPQVVLKSMVARADEAYKTYDLEAKAEALKLDNPLQVITVASLVQAEGKTADDYRKMAEVVYNRLDRANPQTYGFLQFDSTFNYLKGESKIDIAESEITKNKDPYNTYTNKGLPPGPIGNPGEVAIKATLNPTSDGWYYFVATDGVNKTEFAKTHQEFQRLKEKFNARTGN